jgi:cell division protease FtsH
MNIFYEIGIQIILIIIMIFVYLKFYKKSIIEDKYEIVQPGKVNTVNKTSFNDVIGLLSVKEELKYYLDFIKNRDKYTKHNVKLPKGILLVGNPGTGKTLLVKALATEAKIPIIHTSGSEFVEIYVGMGASRVRNLFAKAKKYEKCIIFIDEIDAIGRKRNKSSNDNSERDNTLNQLLVEMDGFNDRNNIIVFAATNLVSTLDSALTRSGRFDKKIYFDLPNLDERKQMFKLYLKGVDHPSIDLIDLSKRTAGISGADIANICNQAKILAIQKSNDVILTDELINHAIDEVLIGREKPERKMSDKERNIVAHHEAGHAFMGYILKGQSPPIKVSIIPRGESTLGFAQQEPNDNKLYDKTELLSKICVLMGGRVAESIFFDQITSGASDDIEKLTALISSFVNTCCFDSSLPLVNLNSIKSISNKTRELVDTQIIKNINNCEEFTKKQLTQYRDHVSKLAAVLLEKETLLIDDIEKIIPNSLKNSVDIDCDKKN